MLCAGSDGRVVLHSKTIYVYSPISHTPTVPIPLIYNIYFYFLNIGTITTRTADHVELFQLLKWKIWYRHSTGTGTGTPPKVPAHSPNTTSHQTEELGRKRALHYVADIATWRHIIMDVSD